MRVGHGVEERVGLQVIRQPRQELSDVDEVHLQQDVLVQTQDPETSSEQTLLAVTTEDVPHATRHVKGEGLTEKGEYPDTRDDTEAKKQISSSYVEAAADVIYTLFTPEVKSPFNRIVINTSYQLPVTS